MKLDRENALLGALVADAATLGMHWLYDQSHIALVERTGDIAFRHPEPAVYENQKAYFAHGSKRSGELSHYGESVRIVGQLVQEQPYSIAEHQQRFMDAFGPCGSYVGYADRPTKALIARLLSLGDSVDNPTGMDDDQMPALCVLPGLFCSNADQQTLQDAADVISTHSDVDSAINAVATVLEALSAGEAMRSALTLGAAAADGALGDKLKEALTMTDYQPLAAAEHFGMPCHISQGLPVVWHLLLHAKDFADVVRDNIRCGGDSCGRAVIVGAVAGYRFGVPDEMVLRVDTSHIPQRSRN